MAAEDSFSAREWLRYARQIQLPEVGPAGQQRLRNARVLIVGAGGLGTPAALYLAGAGVGRLTLVDGDAVALSNLHRQVLYAEADIGADKAQAAARQLRARNADIEVRAVAAALGADNVDELVADADLVLDCTDRMAVRYRLNAACRRREKPWLFAAVDRFAGQLALFVPEGACFQCLYPRQPEGLLDCAAAGVLGVVPGLLGLLQAGEALKHLLGLETPSSNHLLLWDALGLELRRLRLRRDPDCLCCASSGRVELPPEPACAAGSELELAPAAFATALERGAAVLVDVRSAAEFAAFNLGGLNIPLDELDAQDPRLGDRPLLLVCQTGVRSRRGAEQLRAAGRAEAFSLRGGILGWLEERGAD
ncbi:MAG TPA: HesA/MoeB/ThiF family protein [Porticoccaceae bacterium]|nr:HesA/MoeB/ThiF family protein [Porticoccaceae bacterium]